MTTITTNGYFLIADKKVTSRGEYSSVSKDGVEYEQKKFVATTVECVKINVAKGMKFKGRNIVAIAKSGNLDASTLFIKNCLKNKNADIFDVATGFNTAQDAVRSKGVSFSLVLLLEGGDYARLRFYKFLEDNGEPTSRFSYEIFKAGFLSIFGSGSNFLGSLSEAGVWNWDKVCKEVHPLNIHLAASYWDDASSTCYDAYSLEENALALGIYPTKDAVLEAVQILKSYVHFGL